MTVTDLELQARLAAWLWVLARVGGFVSVLPMPGATAAVPMRIRVALALALSLLIVSFVPDGPDVPVTSAHGVLILGQEVVLGLVVGFTVRIVFVAVQLAGHLISVQMGLGFALLIDPRNNDQLSLLSYVYYVLAIVLFLALDGHLVLLDMMVQSFHVLPIGMEGMGREQFWSIALWASTVFSGGVWVSLPVVVALLVVNLSFGVITRAAPQLNVFIIGFPVTLLLGMGATLYAMSYLPMQLGTLLNVAFKRAASLIGMDF